jgi:DNA excision repair protein ERCC-3
LPPGQLPSEVVEFIRLSTETYGKAKLLLRENEYYIEAESKEVARTLLKNDVIRVRASPDAN